jgi:hypothetical protein
VSEPCEIEIRASNHPHPDRKHGQHVNGPRQMFIRCADGSWHVVLGTHQMHVVRAWIREIGLDAVLAQHCQPIEEPTP